MPSDVLIIGAGVNGLLSALSLSQAGLRVTIVERGAVAAESTWAGAGILSPLLPWDYGAEVNALTERGRGLWPQWIRYLQGNSRIDPEYQTTGMLVLGLADKIKPTAWCIAHGWPSMAPPASLAAITSDPAHSLWLPDVAQVRNPRLGQALAQACRLAGIEIFHDTPALALDIEENHIHGVLTSRGKLAADLYVVSAGAWSQTLLADFASGLDVQPVRGQILLFQGTPGQVPCIIYQGGRYLIPRQDGLVLAGSTLEQVGFDKTVTVAAREELLSFALDTVPSLKSAEVIRHWAGLRPGSPGNIPTVGRHPSLGNLYINSGQFRYGVTMAPASAELLCDLILQRQPYLDPRPYQWPETN